MLIFSLFRAIDKYEGRPDAFDGMAVLRTLGNFLGVFLGAFALGSAMGCVTALVGFFLSISTQMTFRYKLLKNVTAVA